MRTGWMTMPVLALGLALGLPLAGQAFAHGRLSDQAKAQLFTQAGADGTASSPRPSSRRSRRSRRDREADEAPRRRHCGREDGPRAGRPGDAGHLTLLIRIKNALTPAQREKLQAERGRDPRPPGPPPD